MTLDPVTHTLYTADWGHASSSSIDGAHCNAFVRSGCGRPPRTLDVGYTPTGVVLDRTHGTLYVTNAFDVTVSVVQTSG